MEMYSGTDVTSNLGSDFELSESIECKLLTSEVESKAELGVKKEDKSEPEDPHVDGFQVKHQIKLASRSESQLVSGLPYN